MISINIVKPGYYFITDGVIKHIVGTICPEWSDDKINSKIKSLNKSDYIFMEKCIDETFDEKEYDTKIGIERALNQIWNLGYEDDRNED
jgi:hypothetical protein